MKLRWRTSGWTGVVFWGLCSTALAQGPGEGKKLKYPESPRGDTVDVYHGRQVADPYRWLEEPHSPATRRWIDEQNKLTFGHLQALPARAALKERLTALWNFERYGVPTARGGRYFYWRNDGLQNQNVLYVADSLAAAPRVLLDPNALSPDGTVAVSGFQASDDGALVAYALSRSGSDWLEWRVREVAGGIDRPDVVKWSKFSGAAWTKDARGFYYGRYDEPAAAAEFTGTNYFQKLYYHRLGTPQSDDALVYERRDQKEWSFDGEVSEDGRYLVISVRRSSERKNQLFYQDLSRPGAPVVELLTGFDAEYRFVGNDGPVFWVLTDSAAPRHRLVAIDTRAPAREQWQELIPERTDVLLSASVVGDQFFAVYLQDAKSAVRRFGLNGRELGELPLPGIGSVAGFTGRRQDRETFYSFTSFTEPAAIYRYDLATGQSSLFRRPQLDFPAADYETRQVFYSSRDGRRVPMFLVHRKGLRQDGANPTLLYGYGGFGISLTPSFAASRLAWLERGGVFAMPNLRGGGEYGRQWHEAGMRENKQRVFDDFLAAAEWLVREKYTSPARLAIQGQSNGGLLVGACLTQRPELFGAALPGVGVMDMLRFHKYTIGWAWVPEFGSADESEMFPTLLAYSPLHNLKPGVRYPATLVTTADHDDRVVPAHSFKFAAALQAAQAGDAPVLIRIETKAGHGAGKPISKAIEETADSYAFLISALGVDAPPAGK